MQGPPKEPAAGDGAAPRRTVREQREQAGLCGSGARPGPTDESDEEDLGLVENLIRTGVTWSL